MLRKTAFGIVLTLLLIAMFTSAFDVHVQTLNSSLVATNVYVDPSTSTFYTNTTSVGDHFTISVKVSNVADLSTWEVKLYFNSTQIEAAKAWIPKTDPTYVFYGKTTVMPTPVINNVTGYVLIGDSIILGSTFSGSGLLAKIEFEIMMAPQPNAAISCVLNINNVDTYLLDSLMNTIPSTKTNGNYQYIWSPSAVASLSVVATSPHVANGTDFSKVTINGTDAYGDPVVGADILVRKNQGEDDQKIFETIDHGNGTYTAQVNSTISGLARIWAIDNATGLMADCRVYFNPGPLAKVQLRLTNPREGHPKNASEVIVMAMDAFNNLINSSRCIMTITTNLGSVGPVIDEQGVFRTTIVSNNLGIANVTAIAYDLAYNLTRVVSANVTFPTIYFYASQDFYIIGSIFTVPVNVYVSSPTRALGYYDLELTFNSSVIQFMNASDGDIYDEFEAPDVKIGLCNSRIQISQKNNVSLTSPTGSIDIANLTFKAVEVGYTSISIRTPFTTTPLVDTMGVPIPVTPTPQNDTVTVKKPPIKTLHLNILVMLDADNKTWPCNESKIIDQITFARGVYGVWNLKCCCNIFISYEIKTIPHDPKSFKTCNDTALNELLEKHKKNCSITIIYIKEYCNCSATAFTSFYRCTNNTRGIIMTCKSCKGTLAHELGHALLGFHSSFDDHRWCFSGGEAPSDNVMHPSHLDPGHTKDCKPINKWNLTKKQRDRIMRCNNPLLKNATFDMPCGYYKWAQNVSLSGFLPGLPPSSTVDAYLIPDGANFSQGNEVAMATIVLDENQTFLNTHLWTVDQIGNYDLWIDYNRNGIANLGEYITYEEVGLYRITTVTHDIAVMEVNPYKTIVGQGYSVPIKVTFKNQGDAQETLCIALYHTNLTDLPLGFQILTLTSGSSTTITFTWNTTSFARDNYTIWAYAWPVPGEVDVTNNPLIDGWIIITILGDINGDFRVDVKDLVLVIKYYATYPGHPNWNPNNDVNCDGKVDIKDLVLVIKHFGEHYP